MKHLFCSLLSFLLVLGCTNENKLTFEPLHIENEACDLCPNIEINLPQALGEEKLAKTINTALTEAIISLLLFEEEIAVTTIDEAMTSFKKAYIALQEQYDDEATNWEANIEGSVSFENDDYLTIALDSYLFTGGAHGYTSQQFLNFDKKKGIELENSQLFKNEADFQAFAEAVFRKKEQIPQEKPINYTGFMFETDSFYLPENIGFTSEGLKLLYNPYEIASYADGPIEMVLPHNEIKKYLVEKSKD